MKYNAKLTQAIAMAIAGTALTVSAVSSAQAASTTMYNLTTSGGADNSTNATDPTTGGAWALSGNTDGWIYGYTTANPNLAANGTNSVAKWAGTTGANTTPFGYAGAHLNWALEMSGGAGGTATISTFDARSRYGVYADVDTAQGAWSDNVSTNVGVAGGWRHDLDFGLFRSDTTGRVTLSAEGVINAGNTNYGFTIFKGMSRNASYGHHGSWNSTTNTLGLTANSLPGGGTNFDPDGAGPQTALGQIVAYSIGNVTPSTSAPGTNIGSISFDAQAGQIYTILIGGYRTGDWGTTIDGYKLTVSQVPVPAAVWLFGSALTGIGIIGRRKEKAAAA